jgi:hypothetical protein
MTKLLEKQQLDGAKLRNKTVRLLKTKDRAMRKVRNREGQVCSTAVGPQAGKPACIPQRIPNTLQQSIFPPAPASLTDNTPY